MGRVTLDNWMRDSLLVQPKVGNRGGEGWQVWAHSDGSNRLDSDHIELEGTIIEGVGNIGLEFRKKARLERAAQRSSARTRTI